MIQRYEQLLILRKKIYGLDKGFNYLDDFLDEIKKTKIDFGLKVYDYRFDEFFFVDPKIINDKVQKYYTNKIYKDFGCENYFFSLIFEKSKLKMSYSSDKAFEIFIASMLKLMISSLRNFTLIHRFDNNKIDKESLKASVIKSFTSFSGLTNQETHYNLYIFFIQILEELKLLSSSYYSYSISNINFFFDLKTLTSEYVEVSEMNNKIKFSATYATDNLIYVIDNYISSIYYVRFRELQKYFQLNNYLSENEFINFVTDFYDCRFFVSNLEFKDTIARSFLEKVCWDKFFINEYCFQVILISCFENYFFSKSSEINMLFKKNDLSLRMNINVYHITC